jgi:hypothetical protein
MIKRLAEEIRKEVFQRLDEIYNYRKDREGLVSAQNCLINQLKQKINEWVEEKSDK